ncbi:MAG: M14 family zinc carboxypeptidase [Bacteriovoracaceae bacterium]|jgi:hypothetical protein|nr:M14 family zinc carboxypeptidase [Bacteriovoracaceae bacterium]
MNFVLLAVLTCSVAFASLGRIDEQVYIKGHNKDLIKLIESQPALTMDHMDLNGFELYGPKGTIEWLNSIGVSYKVPHNHKEFLRGYPSFSKIQSDLKQLASNYPKIAKLFSIGKSVQGRDLWVMKISDNVDTDEMEPEFKYISSMHGDEITGRELTQFLIRDILESYGKDEKITALVNNTEIYIMVSMNPDGSELRQRANANDYDLNRNFPNWTAGEENGTRGRQPETIAVMNFQKKRNFSLSANFHGGAVCVNYPWDSSYKRHPYNDLLIKLSLVYADLNPQMRNSTEFDRGITNGADWYVLKGGMQDWSYIWHNDMQVTVELSDRKWPRYSKIPGFYKKNKASMLAYMEKIHAGAGFYFADKSLKGEVQILDSSNKDLGTFNFVRGQFYKVLDNGTYDFIVTTSNGKVKEFTSIVNDSIKTNGNYKKL